MSAVTVSHMEQPYSSHLCQGRVVTAQDTVVRVGAHSSSSAEGPQFPAAFPISMTVFVVVEFGFKVFLFTWQFLAVVKFPTWQAQPLLSVVLMFDCFSSKASANVSDYTLYASFPAIQNLSCQTVTLAVRKDEN